MTTDTILGSLGHLCLAEHLADVTFTFSKDDGATKLPAHKLILAMRSEVFEAMFYGLLKETTAEIRIEDINVNIFKHLLRYAYTDEADFTATDTVECLYAAKKYGFHGLVSVCSEKMKSGVTTANACTLYEQAKFFDVADLANKCFTFIVKNAGRIMKTADFCRLSNQSVCRILSSEDLVGTSEIDNFSGLYRWAKAKSTGEGHGASPDTIREVMGDALYQVRLPLVPVEAFIEVVVKSEVLTPDETKTLYHHLTSKSSGTKRNVGQFSPMMRQSAFYIAHIPAQNHHAQPYTDGCHRLWRTTAITLKIDSSLKLRLKWILCHGAVKFVSAKQSHGNKEVDITPAVFVEDGGKKLVFTPPVTLATTKSGWGTLGTAEWGGRNTIKLTANPMHLHVYDQVMSDYEFQCFGEKVTQVMSGDDFQCFGSKVTIITYGYVQSVCFMR